ncbi:hypothetical protein LCGC14_1441000 [marine sediment metagenome]|uniref:Uncharacterized protein n=1 Tax=marine sediment metagenome TaxID=412755 RepID=A0A0F9JLB2_9ZZZZ
MLNQAQKRCLGFSFFPIEVYSEHTLHSGNLQNSFFGSIHVLIKGHANKSISGINLALVVMITNFLRCF